jgi:hypothetical protein
MKSKKEYNLTSAKKRTTMNVAEQKSLPPRSVINNLLYFLHIFI